MQEAGEDPDVDPDDFDSNSNVLKRKYETPAQEKLRAKVLALETQLNAQYQARDLSLDPDCNYSKQIAATKKDLLAQKQLLKNRVSGNVHQSKYREKIKSKLTAAASATGEDTSKAIGLRPRPGRPRIEESQENLLETLIEIAIHGSAAHERRQTDEIRSCRTLSDLQEKLKELNYDISRSATYLRLLPRNSRTEQGKRHVITVPVRLASATNDEHKSHPDGKFCTATIRSLESLASMLGPEQTAFISQDDKARVRMGLPAAKEQSPVLMHVEYRMKLPDHDWVIAEKHKLIPSVIAGIVIKPNGQGKPEAVSYSGPTYIAIRSGKHSSSTAATHAFDFQKLVDLDSFKEILRTEDGLVKPILIITADGGPDENPR